MASLEIKHFTVDIKGSLIGRKETKIKRSLDIKGGYRNITSIFKLRLKFKLKRFIECSCVKK